MRAVKADPKVKWPDHPDFLPTWKADGNLNYGDQVFLDTEKISRDPSDLRTATVNCGNQMSVKIRVLPEGEMVVYSSRVVVERQRVQTPDKNSLRIYTRINPRPLPVGSKVRFVATYPDGTRADLINKTGIKDDVAPLKDFRASANLRTNTPQDSVVISAQLVDKSGHLILSSDMNTLVKFVNPPPEKSLIRVSRDRKKSVKTPWKNALK